MAAYVTGYGLLKLDRLRSDDDRPPPLNGVGSALVLVRLFDSCNLPSFITQALWPVLTIVGFVRARTKA